MYWVYQKRIRYWRNQCVQAKLVQPRPKTLRERYGALGFRDPMQDEPYGVDLVLTYQINPKHPHPDNYFESNGFTLHSKRLVDLMQSFDVKAEVFPVKMVDRDGNAQPGLEYFVFHSFEGVLEAMDEELSEWTGDGDVGIPRLVLDETKFQHRPIFLCNHIYIPLMRHDLKQEIQRQGITGFAFLAPEQYRSGSYGFPPEFDD